MSKDRHVVVLGLDGLPLSMLHNAINRGYMPFTTSFLRKSAVRDLMVDLPFTLSSWSSISTGCNPGKHGVFDCVMPGSDGELALVTRDHLEMPSFTEIAALNGLKSITINVPMTCPPLIKRNHVVVSDWTYPHLTAWPDVEVPIVRRFMEKEGPPRTRNIAEWIENILDTAERRAEMIRYYYVNREWDVFYAVLPETDWVFHVAFGEMLEGTGVGAKALRLFSIIDKLIKDIVLNAPENTLFISCSDHGFMQAEKSLNINVLFMQENLLISKVSKLPLKARLVSTLAKYAPPWIKKRVKYGIGFMLARKLNVMDIFTTGKVPIDYGRSKVFATISYNVYVNPAIEGDERTALIEKVKKLLLKYSDLLEVVEEGRKYFNGPYTERAPAIIVIPKEGANISTRLIYKKPVEHGKWYVHSPRGTIIISMIDEDTPPQIPSIVRNVDVAPTALAHVNVPIDPEIDGSVLLKGMSTIKYRKYRPIYSTLKKVTARRKKAKVNSTDH